MVSVHFLGQCLWFGERKANCIAAQDPAVTNVKIPNCLSSTHACNAAMPLQ